MTFEVDCLLHMQSNSTQQLLSANASAAGNVSSYAASETGDHLATTTGAQGIVTYELPVGHMMTRPNVTPSGQPATVGAYEHQTELG